MTWKLFLQINEYDYSPVNLFWENDTFEIANCNRDILQNWIVQRKEHIKDWFDVLSCLGCWMGGASAPIEPNLVGNDGKLYKFTIDQKLYEHLASDNCEVIICI